MKTIFSILILSSTLLTSCGKETTVGPTGSNSPMAGDWTCSNGSFELRASDSVIVFKSGTTLPLAEESRWFLFNNDTKLGQILEINYKGLLLKLSQQPVSYIGAKWQQALIGSMSSVYDVTYKGDSLHLASGAFKESCWR